MAILNQRCCDHPTRPSGNLTVDFPPGALGAHVARSLQEILTRLFLLTAYQWSKQLARVIAFAEVVLGTFWWHSCIPVTHASSSNSSKLVASPAGLGQSPFFDLVGTPVGKGSHFPASSSTPTIFYSFSFCQHTVCMVACDLACTSDVSMPLSLPLRIVASDTLLSFRLGCLFTKRAY